MSEIFESKWGETKAALTEGLQGNKKWTAGNSQGKKTRNRKGS